MEGPTPLFILDGWPRLGQVPSSPLWSLKGLKAVNQFRGFPGVVAHVSTATQALRTHINPIGPLSALLKRPSKMETYFCDRVELTLPSAPDPFRVLKSSGDGDGGGK